MKTCIVMTGYPCSGKSAIGKSVALLLKIPYISSGDIARQMAEEEINADVNTALKNGMMATEDKMRSRMYEILKETIKHNKIFILDGFPRFDDQRLWIEKQFDINYVYIDIQARLDNILARAKSRCRQDDDKSILIRRIEWYEENTMPMLKQINPIVISGDASIEDASNELIRIISEVIL